MSEAPAIEIRDNPAAQRFEAWLDGELAGIAEYQAKPGRLVFVHTQTLPGFEGRGVGRRLAAGALNEVRARGLRVTPHCPFIAAWIRAHPEYADMVVGVRGSRRPPRSDGPGGGPSTR